MQERNEHIITRVVNVFFVVYAGLIPLGTALQNIGIGVFLALWLLEVFITRKFSFKHLFTFFLFIGFYIWSVISMGYSENVISGLHNLYRMAPLLAFPIIGFLRKDVPLPQKLVQKAVLAFLFSLAFTMVLNLGHMLFEHEFNFHKIVNLPGRAFSEGVVNFHYLQLAFYLSVAILLGGYYLLYSKVDKKLKPVIWSILAFFLFMMVLLGGRTSLASTLLFGAVMLLPKLGKGKILFRNIFLLSVFAAIAVGVVIKLDLPLVEKVKETINYQGKYTDLNKVWGGRMMRQEIWHCDIELIKQRPVFGYGLGNVQQYIDSCLKETSERPELYLGSFRFNAHNQFFQITLASGLIGMVLFLIFCLVSLTQSIKQRNWPFVVFMMLSLFSFLTESMLQRNLGVNFFAFFCTLLYMKTLETSRG